MTHWFVGIEFRMCGPAMQSVTVKSLIARPNLAAFYAIIVKMRILSFQALRFEIAMRKSVLGEFE